MDPKQLNPDALSLSDALRYLGQRDVEAAKKVADVFNTHGILISSSSFADEPPVVVDGAPAPKRVRFQVDEATSSISDVSANVANVAEDLVPVVSIPAAEYTSKKSVKKNTRAARKTKKTANRSVKREMPPQTFNDRYMRSKTYALCKPLLTLGNIASAASESDNATRRAYIDAFLDLFEDPFKGIHTDGLTNADFIQWIIQPDAGSCDDVLKLSLQLHRRALAEVAILVHQEYHTRKEGQGAGTALTRSADISSTETFALKERLESRGFAVSFLNHPSDFSRAASAGALFKEFPALIRIEFSSVVTLGARHKALVESWNSLEWLRLFLKSPNPRPAMWSAQVLSSQRADGFQLTTDVSSFWKPHEGNRFIGSFCIYCAHADDYVKNVEVFPGICVACCRSMFEVQIKHTGTSRGRGLFATSEIDAGVDLFEYEGELLSSSQLESRYGPEWKEHRKCPYVMQIRSENGSVESDVYIDAERFRGLAAFVNHSDMPNCAYTYREGRIFVTTVEEIEEGTELLVSYGNDITFPPEVPVSKEDQENHAIAEEHVHVPTY